MPVPHKQRRGVRRRRMQRGHIPFMQQQQQQHRFDRSRDQINLCQIQQYIYCAISQFRCGNSSIKACQQSRVELQ